jgi:hypothetical protein
VGGTDSGSRVTTSDSGVASPPAPDESWASAGPARESTAITTQVQTWAPLLSTSG